MRWSILATAAAAACLAPVAVTAQKAETATAALKSAEGGDVGRVTLRQTASGVIVVQATGTGLPPGEHGFHIHETGQCDASGGFKSAGGHLAGDRKHGVLVEGGPHPGDLPNVTVAGDGKLAAEFFLTRLEMDGNGWFDEVGLFDDDGSAVVIHSGPDDYRSQPSGASGDRIACGVFEKG